MPFNARPRFTWKLRSHALPLGRRTLLMGILNVTPDSFSDGAHFLDPKAAHAHALALLDAGADLLDIGGESTRPGAAPVTPEEEQRRILPVLRSLHAARPNAILSVDTYHAETARLALAAGAHIINDVSGLLWDSAMANLLAQTGAGAILMHTRGAPSLWTTMPILPKADILPLVRSGLTHSLHLARAAGIPADHIVLDPGFGFGKLGDANFVLHAHFDSLQDFALPLLAGTSRKRFLTAHLGDDPGQDPSHDQRTHATIASSTAAILAGAHILRVHDIPAAKVAASVADAILTSTQAA